MPASPEDGARHAQAVANLAADVELWMLEDLARTMRADLDRDDWADLMLSRIRLWRQRAEAGVAGARKGLAEAVELALIGAQTDGIALALADLPDRDAVPPGPGRGVLLDAEKLTERLAQVLQQSPRLLEQTLRRAVDAGAQEVLGGKVTRLQAAQHVLDRLTSKGIVGFRDVAGRNWSLTSYTEMAVRTETAAAAIEGHTSTLQAHGVDLIMVSDSPRECPLCRPFEGKVLSLSGATAGGLMPSVTGGPAVRVEVMTTLTIARQQGFQHPNCTHSVRAFLPGATEVPKGTANPDGYEAKARQREIERKIREWKRAEVLALDDAAASKARAKIRDWQGALRDHVDAHKLKRLSYREQIDHAT